MSKFSFLDMTIEEIVREVTKAGMSVTFSLSPLEKNPKDIEVRGTDKIAKEVKENEK